MKTKIESLLEAEFLLSQATDEARYLRAENEIETANIWQEIADSLQEEIMSLEAA